jgi:hypothetical protein
MGPTLSLRGVDNAVYYRAVELAAFFDIIHQDPVLSDV